MFKWHLKNILKSRNISQAEFSRRTKMREATLSLYCHGKLKEARIKDLHAMCKEVIRTGGLALIIVAVILSAVM